ncbi:MAG TPA: hypothetical protein VG274_04715 [Rhizomicrobium sp.]|nr:hypothetical protein [Rhizomicrobium sp.]
MIVALDIKDSLEDGGAEIIGPSYTPSDALDAATHAEIAAAVLDLRLGRESVGPVARVLAQRNIPFVFYSGQPAGDPVRAEWPDVRLISKPATPRDLVEAVAALLR